MKKLSFAEINKFQKTIYTHYKKDGRNLPWRKTTSPYRIYISEIMLQQTQVDRVLPKYKSFIKKFPNFKSLAAATLQEVLLEWQGLGYNRRAKMLKESAQTIATKYKGKIPQNKEELTALPGVGPYTAEALLAFVYQKRAVCIETNIRTVFIYYFFKNRKNIDDKEILPLIEETLDENNVREWYFALMDYGSMIKKEHGNFSKNSAHYAKQSTFEGSNRQVRGEILKILSNRGKMPAKGLINSMSRDKTKIQKQINSLVKEGFIENKKGALVLM